MKNYEKELKQQMVRAEKIALAGLGFVIAAQRKLEKAAKDALSKNNSAARAKAKKVVDAAVKEQKIAQKKLQTGTKKALAMLVKESKKRLDQLDKKLR